MFPDVWPPAWRAALQRLQSSHPDCHVLPAKPSLALLHSHLRRFIKSQITPVLLYMRNVLFGYSCTVTKRKKRKKTGSLFSVYYFLPVGELVGLMLGVSDSGGLCWKVRGEYCVLERGVIAVGLCLVAQHLLGKRQSALLVYLLFVFYFCFFSVQAGSIETHNNLRIWMLDYWLRSASERVLPECVSSINVISLSCYFDSVCSESKLKSDLWGVCKL